MTHWVYMLASQRNWTLYTGVAMDLVRRVEEHRSRVREGFTTRYGVDLLVWYEAHDQYVTAAQREKRIKKWPRAWKINLIEENNPGWRDLFDDFAASR
ncbi:GIY-YIG nuclease family protein [Zavarzinia sp. CC-PAN008]|uniref:GIY-YIG nuclease family protein n=1 Tax=Zavarzinia sp. CC-PAN008 TaxID=3243332 RepID=UPI003F7493B7